MINKAAIKRMLGELPLTAELYWQLRQPGKPLSKSFSLRRTERHLPQWVAQASAARQSGLSDQYNLRPKRIMLFAALRYWIEHAALLSTALAGLGHQVTLSYLPYANYQKPFNRFDLRRQDAYARRVLGQASPLIQVASLLDFDGSKPLPAALSHAVE